VKQYDRTIAFDFFPVLGAVRDIVTLLEPGQTILGFRRDQDSDQSPQDPVPRPAGQERLGGQGHRNHLISIIIGTTMPSTTLCDLSEWAAVQTPFYGTETAEYPANSITALVPTG